MLSYPRLHDNPPHDLSLHQSNQQPALYHLLSHGIPQNAIHHHPFPIPAPYDPRLHLDPNHDLHHQPQNQTCIPALIPPGMDPSQVDIRTFYPYTPNEVKHRKRTTRAQLKVLEGVYKYDTKPNASLRKKLAAELDMTPRGVQVLAPSPFVLRRVLLPFPLSTDASTSLFSLLFLSRSGSRTAVQKPNSRPRKRRLLTPAAQTPPRPTVPPPTRLIPTPTPMTRTISRMRTRPLQRFQPLPSRLTPRKQHLRTALHPTPNLILHHLTLPRASCPTLLLIAAVDPSHIPVHSPVGRHHLLFLLLRLPLRLRPLVPVRALDMSMGTSAWLPTRHLFLPCLTLTSRPLTFTRNGAHHSLSHL